MSTFKPITAPIKSNDVNYMYNYCRSRIQNASNPDELLPIIKYLIPMNSLKHKLLEILDSLHENSESIHSPTKQFKHSNGTTPKPSSPDNAAILKRLYLNSSSLAEIFPDHILVKIIRFIPSQQFGILPVLSCDFRSIMTKYAVLYHDYKVVIDEIPTNFSAQRIRLLINHSKRSIYIKMAEMQIDSMGLEHAASASSLMFNASFDRFLCFPISFHFFSDRF